MDKKDFVRFDYSDNYRKFVSDKQELIFKKESKYELGGENLNSVAYTLFTEDDELVGKDEIIVIGKDLSEIKKDSSFARIALVKTKGAYERGEQASYYILETINHIENPNLLATKIIVPHKLIPRESCCPPPEV